MVMLRDVDDDDNNILLKPSSAGSSSRDIVKDVLLKQSKDTEVIATRFSRQ